MKRHISDLVFIDRISRLRDDLIGSQCSHIKCQRVFRHDRFKHRVADMESELCPVQQRLHMHCQCRKQIGVAEKIIMIIHLDRIQYSYKHVQCFRIQDQFIFIHDHSLAGKMDRNISDFRFGNLQLQLFPESSVNIFGDLPFFHLFQIRQFSRIIIDVCLCTDPGYRNENMYQQITESCICHMVIIFLQCFTDRPLSYASDARFKVHIHDLCFMIAERLFYQRMCYRFTDISFFTFNTNALSIDRS